MCEVLSYSLLRQVLVVNDFQVTTLVQLLDLTHHRVTSLDPKYFVRQLEELFDFVLPLQSGKFLDVSDFVELGRYSKFLLLELGLRS